MLLLFLVPLLLLLALFVTAVSCSIFAITASPPLLDSDCGHFWLGLLLVGVGTALSDVLLLIALKLLLILSGGRSHTI